MFEFVIFIALAGVIFFQYRKIDSLNAKLFQCQQELKKYKEANTVEPTTPVAPSAAPVAQPITPVTPVVEASKPAPEVKPVEPVKPVTPKKEVDPIASRNLTILITGSVLIVLAAIVFLTTAWQTIPDFIKTVVLFLVAFVFLGASKISKEKYNLEKTSKTFFYIGMAYLPICLLSISIFGLFGSYLSATGAGKYIYLGFSALVLAILYYYISKKSEDKYIFYGSLLSQIFSVILFTLMFEERLFLVCINLLLYNLLLMIITKDKAFELVTKIIPGVITILAIGDLIDDSWYHIITCALLSANFLYLDIKKTSIVKASLFNIFLFAVGYLLVFKDSFDFEDGTIQSLLTLFTGAVVVIESLVFSNFRNSKNLLASSRVIGLLSMLFVYGATLDDPDNMVIPSYIIAILIEALFIFNLKTSKVSLYKYLAYAFSNVVLIDAYYNLVDESDVIKYIPLITSAVIMLYEMYAKNEKDQFLPIYVVGAQAISLLIASIDGTEGGVVLALAFALFSLYYNKKTKAIEVFNIVPILCMIPCIKEANLDDQLELGIMLLSTIGLTYLSVRSGSYNMYTFASGIYLVLTVGRIENEYLNEVLCIIWSAVHVYFCKNEKADDVFKVLTAICCTRLYYSFITEIELNQFTLFEVLGVVVLGMYIIKYILAKSNKDTDTVEYIFWGLVYLYALSSYADSQDGIIFSILIVAVIFYSYYKRYGATFLASIIAILINGFALTREFWLSVPWWIYLLVVGGTLVGFAMKNEASENQKKLSVGSVLKEIKDKVDNK